MAISASDFDTYAVRQAAVELSGDGSEALFTNISDDPKVRRDYWLKVHEHERAPGSDKLEFRGSRLSRADWKRIAALDGLPNNVRALAADMAKAGKAGDGKKADAELEMGRAEAARVLAVIRKEVGVLKPKAPAIRLRKGRGGRTQYRLTAEFPDGLDSAARLRIAAQFCGNLQNAGAMYVAAIHEPDHHNDKKNFHFHLAYHDRPARFMTEYGMWDFEYREKVPNQHDRYRYPYRQKKIAAFTRDPDGGNHRKYGASKVYDMRKDFAALCNEELEQIGSTRLFDPRTYEEMGINQKPTQHLGSKAASLENVGVPTSAGMTNAETIWTAALQEHHATCEENRRSRRHLLARSKEAASALETAGARALAEQLQNLVEKYRVQLDCLEADEFEVGEFRLFLMMAYSRALRTEDTCTRILNAIDEGKASKTEMRNRPLIERRKQEADGFLNSIDAFRERCMPLIDPFLKKVHVAWGQTPSIEAALTRVLETDVPAALVTARTMNGNHLQIGLEAASNGPVDLGEKGSQKIDLDDLFERILKKNCPVLLPDEEHSDYRVPGITRAEFQLLSSPHIKSLAQSRLAGIAKVQHDRMASAARMYRTHGVDALRSLAVANSDARWALFHLEACRDHPSLVAMMGQGNEGNQSRAFDADVLLDQLISSEPESLERRDISVQQDLGPDPSQIIRAEVAPQFAKAAPEIVEVEPAPIRSVQSDPARDEAIAAYADFIRTDPDVRIAENDGVLRVEPKSVSAFAYSAAAFADEGVVQMALKERWDADRLAETPSAPVTSANDYSQALENDPIRNAAISRFADFIRTEESVRFVEVDGKVRIDPASIPGWELSAEVFEDHDLVKKAVEDRYQTEREIMLRQERAEAAQAKQRQEILEALYNGYLKVERGASTKWKIYGHDDQLVALAKDWCGHPELSSAFEAYVKEAQRLDEISRELAEIKRAELARQSAKSLAVETKTSDARRELEPKSEIDQDYSLVEQFIMLERGNRGRGW